MPMHQTACGRATGAPTRTPGRFDISVRDCAVETTEGSTARHDLPKASGGEGSSMIESFRKRGVSHVCHQSGRQGRGSVWPCGVMRVATDPGRRARDAGSMVPGSCTVRRPATEPGLFPRWPQPQPSHATVNRQHHAHRGSRGRRHEISDGGGDLLLYPARDRACPAALAGERAERRRNGIRARHTGMGAHLGMAEKAGRLVLPGRACCPRR